ncbi:MAG TPA: RnfABCDGE type electron transport complex subunit D, partial [Ferruginibacter sp.]|nr:RnfABCDGE type electron transport complex subunit D [Ferruginibacter sp.]
MASHRIIDARYFQIACQTIFLSYGILYLHWQGYQWLYVTYFISGQLFQFIAEWIWAKHPRFSNAWFQAYRRTVPSALVSSFGLALFLRTGSIGVAVLISAITIFSKYLLRWKGKHLFNPSALGIVVAVWLLQAGWINPGQWGNGTLLFFSACLLGLIVVTRVQKLDLTLSFIFVYAFLLYTRQVWYLGWPVDHFIQSISTGSVLIFSFFMITDPRTTPDHPVARIGWAALVAVLAFYLQTFQFVVGAP